MALLLPAPLLGDEALLWASAEQAAASLPPMSLDRIARVAELAARLDARHADRNP